jgi:hypothetical protein
LSLGIACYDERDPLGSRDPATEQSHLLHTGYSSATNAGSVIRPATPERWIRAEHAIQEKRDE